MTSENLIIAVLGGTGEQGRGLARRFALAGHSVVLGSRSAERAADAAVGLPGTVTGAANAQAAAQGDVVIVAVPWDGHKELLQELAPLLAGKVVIDCVNPLGFDKQGAFALEVEEGSAAQQAAAVLPDSRVVAAFHHVSAVLLLDETVDSVDTDILVLGEDREEREPTGLAPPNFSLQGQHPLVAIEHPQDGTKSGEGEPRKQGEEGCDTAVGIAIDDAAEGQPPALGHPRFPELRSRPGHR